MFFTKNDNINAAFIEIEQLEADIDETDDAVVYLDHRVEELEVNLEAYRLANVTGIESLITLNDLVGRLYSRIEALEERVRPVRSLAEAISERRNRYTD